MTLATADRFKEAGWLANLITLLNMCPSDDHAVEAIRLAEATRFRFHPTESELALLEPPGETTCSGEDFSPCPRQGFVTLVSIDDQGMTSYMTFDQGRSGAIVAAPH